MSKAVSPFVENTDGILTHSGEVRVAKGGVKQKILNVSDQRSVLVMGRRKSYPASIHAELLPLIQYAEKGDTAFVKFKNNEAFIVGFRKNPNRVGKYEKCYS